MTSDYPDFEVAEERLRELLRSEGVSASQLVYVTAADVALIRSRIFVREPAPSARSSAKNDYEAAAKRARGVLLGAFCTLGDSVCAYVYSPIDDDEAERLMYSNGLKLTVPVPLPAARVGGTYWSLVRLRERFFGLSRSQKQELFR